ncbi:hypothetical protein GCM10011383_43280 [Hymenobacter cavernae]|uniref:Uncharacterized protein n=2 Tax=Hymenobacter cavernae TaxID=2044852 RepID=A0ABQ1UVA4_9BACT|nr:hypothetical protein GCM10011383_43280 [Hymenobacter cavernae]
MLFTILTITIISISSAFLVNKIMKAFAKQGYGIEIDKFNNELKRILDTSFILIILACFNILIAVIDAQALKEKSGYQRMVIEYDNKLIRASATSHYIYLGRTKNYTFFYNKQTERAHSYPNSGIKRIYMKNAYKLLD